MTGYLVHCANCCAAIIAFPPRSECEIILVEPCPMCSGGLEQSFSCDYCFQKNAIYWDKRHLVPKTVYQYSNRGIKQGRSIVSRLLP